MGSIAAAGISWLGDVAIMREVRHQTAYLQKQIDELDLQVRWLTTAVKILQAAANKENEACAVIETLANQVRSTTYRVTHQIVLQVFLTSKQKLSFSYNP